MVSQLRKYSTEPENSDQEMPTSTSGAEFIETSHSPPPQLPVRLFARYCYPNKPHLNIYSMAIVIGSIVKSLKGTSELKKLLGSQFGYLFHLPVSRCLNSAKLCDPMVGNVADEFSALTVFEDESGVGKIWKDLFETEDVDVWSVSLWSQTDTSQAVVRQNVGGQNRRPHSSEVSWFDAWRPQVSNLGFRCQPQRRPFRPRRGVGVEPESTDSGEINEELKAWICGELSTPRRVSVCFNNANDAPTVVANDVPTVQTLSPEATILEADQLATAVKAVFHMSAGENSGFPRVEEAPMTTGLNLLAQEVENASGVDQEDSELVDNTLALVLAKPKTFVLPSQDFVESDEVGTSVPDETNSENKETTSPTNSEDYKTPPEESPTAESRTPEGGNVLNRRYSTRLTKIQEGEWKCISVRSTKVEKDKGKRIQKRSTKIGGVYTPDKKLKELFKSCQKPKYTPLADVDVKKFKELRKVLQENPKQVFEIVTGPTVSNQFFLSLARPTNWVTNEGSPTESDDSSKCPKKKTRTKYKHNEDPEDEHSYDAGGSCTPNTLEEGSEEASDSEVDLKDYQEYFQNNHKSRSESSAESD
ncbi:hypothetical protein Bca52824_087095 [Brassica carinata]|uniref:Uncharacterized protein n=1 Tax=Brassica carinata TaxID=52824 RepID=A0A8X7PBA4_BRACI|nr:hypothetical protein Bca52824_087095 [Brassica carinata]